MASPFPAPHTRQLEDVSLWELEQGYTTHIVFDWIHTVRAPFVTDYASTPPGTWWWLGPPSDYSGPAVHHDAWCRASRTYGDRLAADALFLVLLHRWQKAHFKEPRHWYTTLLYLPLEFEWWVDRTAMFLALRLYAMAGFWKNDMGDRRLKATIRKAASTVIQRKLLEKVEKL